MYSFKKGDRVKFVGDIDKGWNLKPGAEAIVTQDWSDSSPGWLYLEWIPGPLVGSAGAGGFFAKNFELVRSGHKFKVDDVVEWVKNKYHYDEIQPGALATVLGYTEIENGTEYLLIKWHDDGKHAHYNDGGWHEEMFKLRKKVKPPKKIKLDDKAFDEIIVPRRSRPIKWKE